MRRIALLFVLSLAVLAVAACGNAGPEGAQPTNGERSPTPTHSRASEQPTPLSDDALSIAYQGLIELPDSSFEFTVEGCHFDPEDMGNRNVRLVVEGAGVDADSQRFDVRYVSVFDGSRRIETLTVDFAGSRRIEARHTDETGLGPTRFSFDASERAISGSSAADVVRGGQHVTTTDIEFRAACPPFTDGQGEGMALP